MSALAPGSRRPRSVRPRAFAPPKVEALKTSRAVAADLSLSMNLLSSPESAPNAPLSYTISVANHGLIDADAVRLENPLPTQIVNTSWQASPGTVSLEAGSRYNWEIDQLAVGETYTFTVTGQFSADLVPGMPLLLSAFASTTSHEVDLGNNQARIYLGEWQHFYLPILAR